MKQQSRARAEGADPLEEATRLLDQGQLSAALAVLAPLHETYPDDPEIAIALGLASLKTNRIARACQAFDRFVSRWPRHRKTAQIEQALADLAQARQNRLRFLGFDESELDIAVAYEESNAFLSSGQFDEARRVTEAVLEIKPQCAPARNNLSYLLWLAGESAQARQEAERVLAEAPDDLQALCHLVRYLSLAGELDTAREVGERVKRVANATADSAVVRMEALSFLADDAAVAALYEEAVAPDSGQDGTNAMLHHLGAVAHARLGNEAAARSLWHQALRVSPQFELAKTNLDDAKARPGDRHGAWPFSLSNWVAARDLSELQSCLQGAGEQGLATAMQGWLSSRLGTPALVSRLLERGDPVGRDFAVMIVTHAGTPEMDALLVAFALGRDGPDELRLTAARRAVERGVLAPGLHPMWLRGHQREVDPAA